MSYNGRLIHIWPIKWHKCLWSWMTLKVTLVIWHFLTYFLENKTHSKFDMCIRIGEHTRGLRSWMTLKVIHQFQSFWNASHLHLCITLQDFNWHIRVARSLSDSWASCFLVYLSFDFTWGCRANLTGPVTYEPTQVNMIWHDGLSCWILYLGLIRWSNAGYMPIKQLKYRIKHRMHMNRIGLFAG